MFVSHVTVNGVQLHTAFVKIEDNLIQLVGLDYDGNNRSIDIKLTDYMIINTVVDNNTTVKPIKPVKEFSKRVKPENSNLISFEIGPDGLTDDQYMALKSKRGRRSQVIADAMQEYEIKRSGI